MSSLNCNSNPAPDNYCGKKSPGSGRSQDMQRGVANCGDKRGGLLYYCYELCSNFFFNPKNQQGANLNFFLCCFMFEMVLNLNSEKSTVLDSLHLTK